jgi:hypothetical protein
MHKIIRLFIVLFSLTCVFTLLTAQNIEFQLGGKTNAESFEIKDSDGKVIFQLKGNGKIGLGSAVLKTAKMHVQGSINSQGVYKIQGKTVLSIKGTENTFMGEEAGKNYTSGTGGNVFAGYQAGYANTTGYYNTFIGGKAGNSNTTGYQNNYIGYLAGKNNVTGVYNNFFGSYAGWKNTGDRNNFHGDGAGFENTTGTENTFMGDQAGFSNTTGINNTFIGSAAGFSNTTGDKNVFNGWRAGNSNTTGLENVFIGNKSGYTNTTGYTNTIIGARAGHNNSTGNLNVFLGFQAGFYETSSNKLYIDNGSTTSPLIWGDFSVDSLRFDGDVHITGNLWVDGSFPSPSDIRFKKNLNPIDNALDGITSLSGVTYKWNQENFPRKNFNTREQIGVIAQDVEDVYPQLVYTDNEGYKRVDYSKLSAVLIEAIKEQQNLIESQQLIIEELRNKNNLIEERLESIESIVQFTYNK